MGLFDFLLGNRNKKQRYGLMVKNFNTKVAKLENELEFKNKEIGSLHMQISNLTDQNRKLVDTIEKLSTRLVEKLENSQVFTEKELKAKEEPEVKNEPSEVMELIEKAESMDRTKKYKKAIELYDDILSKEPEFKEAIFGKAMCLKKTKRTKEALALFEQAIELDKDYKEAWLNKGICLDELGKHKDAIKCFDKVIFINNNRK